MTIHDVGCLRHIVGAIDFPLLPLADSSKFRPYSLEHLVVLAVFTSICIGLGLLGKAWREDTRGRRLDRTLAVLCVLLWIPVQIHGFLPSQYDLGKALPIQVCDIAGLLAPVVLWTSWRPLRAILYYWGVGLSTQAFLQPDLRGGPNDMAFWVFWFGHSIVVAPAIYDLAARGYRPGWKDFGIGVAALAVLSALLLPLNIATGWNYGYIGNSTPDQPSIFDMLGPWPMRLLPLSLLVASGLALFTLPWVLMRRMNRNPRIESAAQVH